VTIEKPFKGIVSVRVYGKSIKYANNKQKFAYVASGTFTEVSCASASLSCPSDCSGHGQCDTSTGACQCSIGWYGLACDAKMLELENGKIKDLFIPSGKTLLRDDLTV
jgi:hypothetical protein